MKKYLLWCIGALLCVSCSSSYYMKKGNSISQTGRSYKAVGKYEKAYRKSKSKEVQRQAATLAGECCEKVNRLSDALAWYKKAERADKEQAAIYLKLAAVSTRRNDFETARDYYTRYDELTDDEQGGKAISTLEIQQRKAEEQGRYNVVLMKEVNSRNNDFSPVFFPGDTAILYLASTRNVNPKRKRSSKDPITGEGYSHIFMSRYTQEVRTKNKKGEIKVRKFKEPRWLTPEAFRDSLYSSRHEGGICFSSDGNTLYFTSSRLVDGYNQGTRIYKVGKAQQKEDMDKVKWTQLAKSGVCGDSVSVGHPALTPDGNRLYFVSDMIAGGLGGKDIWYVEGKDGKWGEPVNAGDAINTEYDELFPYVRDNGDLYFASNRPEGFGGLDIYRSKEGEGVEHLNAPLNSFADDFGIAFRPETDEGVLVSSRSNRSDNIYRFNFIPQQLGVKLQIKNNITDAPVEKAVVTAVCDDGTTFILETDSLGQAGMVILPQREYVFVTEHPRYLKGKGVVSTYREKGDRFYDLSIEMQPIEQPIVLPNIYFDVAKWELRQDAKDNIEVLLTTLKDNPNITIELSAHTDMIGNEQANMTLSENRAAAVVEYLISKGVYWDRVQAKGYGESMPRKINEKDAKAFSFLKPGDILNERFIVRLKGEQKEDAMQLNRRIEFKVLTTNYKPGAQSHIPPLQMKEGTISAGNATMGQLRDIKTVKGTFFTLQLGVFKTVPALVREFKIVFTEKLSNGTVRYCTGIYDTAEAAAKAAAELKAKKIDCIVKKY